MNDVGSSKDVWHGNSQKQRKNTTVDIKKYKNKVLELSGMADTIQVSTPLPDYFNCSNSLEIYTTISYSIIQDKGYIYGSRQSY